MREIKFRGMRSDGKGWVYGYFCIEDGSHQILEEIQTDMGSCLYPVEIDPGTLEQFTGKKDKNGVEIYEGSK